MKKKWLSLPLACMIFISACSTPGKNLSSTGPTGTTVSSASQKASDGFDKTKTEGSPHDIRDYPISSRSETTSAISPTSVPSELALAMPTCSQESFRREFDELVGVFTISCETVGAQIYYSINGGEYQEYDDNNEIYFTRTTKVETYAELSNGRKSETNTYTYELLPRYSIEVEDNSPEAEKITVRIETAVKGATYYYTIEDSEDILFPGLLEVEKDADFKLYKDEADVSDVTFYYTTDGSEPTRDSRIYTEPLEIERNAHFRILAVKEGWSDFRQVATFSLTSSGDSKLEDYLGKHLYNTLSENDKEIYKRIYEELEKSANKPADKVYLADLEIPFKEEQLQHLLNLYYTVYFENPHLLYQPYADLPRSPTPNEEYIEKIDLKSMYIRSDEIKENSETFYSETNKIIEEAKKLSSDYERIRYIHDWIALHTTYGKEEEVGSYVKDTDASPVYGKADCCGYSRFFCYLAQSLGYDAIVVAGKGEGKPHAWNAIKIGNKWYLVDVLWDYKKEIDDGIGYRYFLKSEEEFAATHEKNTVNYDYPEFNSSFA